jgi:hypothetical protein
MEKPLKYDILEEKYKFIIDQINFEGTDISKIIDMIQFLFKQDINFDDIPIIIKKQLENQDENILDIIKNINKERSEKYDVLREKYREILKEIKGIRYSSESDILDVIDLLIIRFLEIKFNPKYIFEYIFSIIIYYKTMISNIPSIIGYYDLIMYGYINNDISFLNDHNIDYDSFDSETKYLRHVRIVNGLRGPSIEESIRKFI